MRTVKARILSDDAVARAAHIIGEQGAMAKAQAECRRRREAGEDVYVWNAGSLIVVGPKPEDYREDAP